MCVHVCARVCTPLGKHVLKEKPKICLYGKIQHLRHPMKMFLYKCVLLNLFLPSGPSLPLTLRPIVEIWKLAP